MFDYGTAGLIIALLMGLVLLGVHVAVALGITSAIGIYLVTGKLRIVEATLADAPTSLSHGTHFFHRLLSNQVLYMSVEHDGRGRIDWGWLDEQESIWESRSVRHVRVSSPLEVRIDCATRYGLIRRREGS